MLKSQDCWVESSQRRPVMMSYWLNAVDINSRQLPLKAKRILHVKEKSNQTTTRAEHFKKIISLRGWRVPLERKAFFPSTRASEAQSFSQSYSWRMTWFCCFSLRFPSSSWLLSNFKSTLHFRARAIISRFSSTGSGAGWSSTQPRCTCTF